MLHDEETVASSCVIDEAVSEATVVVVAGKSAGSMFRVGDNFIIGRADDADLRVVSGDVSRHHARISRLASGSYVVEDLGSKNGIQVNGQQVDTSQLRYGDRISIGDRAVLLFGAGDNVQGQLLHSAKMASIGRLAGGIAHDFNNMLGALGASVEFLRRMPAGTPIDADEACDALDDLNEIVERATKLTQQLLQVARGGRLRDADVDMSALSNDVTRMMCGQVDTAITVKSAIDCGITVTGVESQLHQVLLNLCSNACDAMPHGGELSIRLRRDQSNSNRPIAVLDVEDTGLGMTDEVKQQVFEPFFSTKPRGEGTGLGLATVYGIVASHDGGVTLKSALGRGTTVRVVLPLSGPQGQDTTSRQLDV